jgi:hypothetical protein
MTQLGRCIFNNGIAATHDREANLTYSFVVGVILYPGGHTSKLAVGDITLTCNSPKKGTQTSS